MSHKRVKQVGAYQTIHVTVEGLIKDINDKTKRKTAMAQLVAFQSEIPNLGSLLGASVASLLEEIESVVILITPPANPPGLNTEQARHVHNALSLVKHVALHPITRPAFLQSNVLSCLKPFLMSVDKSHNIRALRIASVRLLEALVHTESEDVFVYLISVNIFRELVSLINTGCEVCKMSSTYILRRLLEKEYGLTFACDNAMRLLQVVHCLHMPILQLTYGDWPSSLLLEHVLRCYSLLSSNLQGLECIKANLPIQINNGHIERLLTDGSNAQRFFNELIHRLRS